MKVGQIWKRNKPGLLYYIEILSFDEDNVRFGYSAKINDLYLKNSRDAYTDDMVSFLRDFTPLTKLDYTLL